MARLALAAPAIVVAVLAVCCGGGNPSSPSGPSATPTPSTPAPTTVTLYPSVEEPASISSEYPHWADFVDPFPPHKYLDAGWNYWKRVEPPHDRSWSGFAAALKFDLAPIARRTVTKATLRLYVLHAKRDPKIAPPIKLNALSTAWDPETITWNVLAGIPFHTSGESRVPTPSTTGPLDWNVTDIVRNWASGAWGNYGLRMSVDRYPDPGYESWASISVCATAGVGDILSPECQRPVLIIDCQ